MFERELGEMYNRVMLLKLAHVALFVTMAGLAFVCNIEYSSYNSTLDSLKNLTLYGLGVSFVIAVRFFMLTAPFLLLKVDQLLCSSWLSDEEKACIWEKLRKRNL